jgi:hypothetical protein
MQFAECRILSVVMLSVVMLSVVMLSGVILSGVMLSVVAPVVRYDSKTFVTLGLNVIRSFVFRTNATAPKSRTHRGASFSSKGFSVWL